MTTVAITAMSVVAPATGAGNPAGGFGHDDLECGNDGTISWTPTTVWPPNHTDVPITWTYEDPSDSNVRLTITSKLHNQIINDTTEFVGSGNTPFATDAFGGTATNSTGNVVDVVGHVRGERSGTDQEGRFYSFEYKAEAGPLFLTDGCESDPDDDRDDIVIWVPHDCRDNHCGTDPRE
jgi:hypothetical protein